MPPSQLNGVAARRALALFVSLALLASAFVNVPRASAGRRQQRIYAPAAAASPTTKGGTPDFVPGEVLVRFRSESKADEALRAAAPLSDASGRELPVEFARAEGLSAVRGLRLARVRAEDTLAAVAALSSRADVLYAEPNYVRRALGIPNDPLFGQQWGLKNTGQPSVETGQAGVAGIDIKAEGAWDITAGSREVVVGVIDSGFDITHPDLQPNVWTNPGETPSNGADDDGNGFADDVHGWDFFHDDSTVFDRPAGAPETDETDFHGTHVAGVVGAAGDNGVGVAGVSRRVGLMSLKVLGPEDSASSSVLTLVRAYNYAKQMRDLFQSSGGTKGANIRVLNNSYGGLGRSQAELDAILALSGSGILFVAAAGNERFNNDFIPIYPASYAAPNVISVASLTRHQGISQFTNTGPRSVHMWAPGDEILSTLPGNDYAFATGTSMAAPHVAGAAALLCAANPAISMTRLRAALLFSGDEFGFFPPTTITNRRLNALKALQTAAEGDTTAPATIGDFRSRQSSLDPLELLLEWTAPGDDGTAGRAAYYEIRLSDTPFTTEASFTSARLMLAPMPSNAGTPQFINTRFPFRHPAGFVGIRAIDNAGNASAVSSIPYAVDQIRNDPYTVATSAAEPLSTGGTRLALEGDDAFVNFQLPFNFNNRFPFFNTTELSVNVSINGVLYFTPNFPRNPDNSPRDAVPFLSELAAYPRIAGLWDDLRVDRRAGDGVYVVVPDPSRVIFRWQAVTFDTPLTPTFSRGENPVNFEIELRSDGTIIKRYGEGNQTLFPVVGIGGGLDDPYVVASHTSTLAQHVPPSAKFLANAQTVTYTRRTSGGGGGPQNPLDLKMELLLAQPDPVGAGRQVTQLFRLANDGPNTAEQTVVNITVPQGVRVVSCETRRSQCSAPPPGQGGTVVVSVGTLGSGSTEGVTLVLALDGVAAGTTLTTTATATNFWTDTNPSNNSATATAQVVHDPGFGTVRAVGAGESHTLAAKTDGTVWAFGSNESGQLGDGTQSFGSFSRLTPVPVQNLSDVTALAGGFSHSLALKSDGTVWGFGGNFKGQLGDGTLVMRPTPVRVGDLTGAKALAAGRFFSLVLKTDGTVWGFGDNESGQLGAGPGGGIVVTSPVQAAGLSGVTAIAAGYAHALAVRSDGTVWSWGSNFDGQLGDGTTSGRATPAQVPGLSGVVAVAAGEKHSLALKADGTVWAWGFNSEGQLGDATQTRRLSPVQVVNFGGGPLGGVTHVAAGARHSMVLKDDFSVWTWGYNGFLQLGEGVMPPSNRSTPVRVVNVSGAVSIAAGHFHGAALMADSTLRLWGRNANGALGDGTSFSRAAPVEVTGISVLPAPTFSVGDLQFQLPVNVTVNCATPGVAIHYTTNGSDPTESDPSVAPGSVLRVDRSLTLKARAFKPGFVRSPVKSAVYVIQQPGNVIDGSQFFVAQHYRDFLGREPDAGGLAFWTGGLEACGLDAQCRAFKRTDTSAAFFLSIEFQETGFLVQRMYRAAYGEATGSAVVNNVPTPIKVPVVRLAELTPDSQRIARDVIVGTPGWPERLEANKAAFALEFVARPRFAAAFPSTMTPEQFVDKLDANAGGVLSAEERAGLVAELSGNNTAAGRAGVLRKVAEDAGLVSAETNKAFVLMQYFGYMRRNPNEGPDTDHSGYNFWLTKLDQFGGDFRQAQMVTAFLDSIEYRNRFGR